MPILSPRALPWVCLAMAFAVLTPSGLRAQSVPLTLEGYALDSQAGSGPLNLSVPLAAPYRAVAEGSTLLVVDATNPSALAVVASVPLGGAIQDLEVNGSLLLAATGKPGLIILNVNNPLAPVLVGQSPNKTALAVAINDSGRYAYVCSGESTFEVIDLKNPAKPTVTRYIDFKKANVYDMLVTGQYLIAAGGPRGIAVYSLNNPRFPKRVSLLKTLTAASRVALNDRLLAVTDGELGLALVEYPTWKDPHLKGNVPAVNQALDCAFLPSDPTKVIVAEGSDGYRIVDATDPNNPTTLAYSPSPAPITSISSSTSSIYLHGGSAGMWRLDLSNPSQPATALALAGSPSRTALACDGNMVYVATDSRIEAWDFGNPAGPVLTGSASTPLPAVWLTVANGLLMASCQSEGVIIYDLSSPALPAQISVVKGHGAAGQSAVQGNMLAFADTTDGVVITDISIPSAPDILSTWVLKIKKTTYIAQGAAFTDATHLWVSFSGQALQGLDITDSTAPKSLAEFTLDGTPQTIYAEGNYVYAPLSTYALEVVDVTNPAKPSKVALPKLDLPSTLFVQGDRLLVCDGWSGLKEFDISDPTKPNQVAFFGAPGFAAQAAILDNGSRVVVTSQGGLWSLSGDSCAGTSLLLPCEGQQITRLFKPLFSWAARSGAKYKLQISQLSTFPDNQGKTFTGLRDFKQLEEAYYVPTAQEWRHIIKKMPIRSTIYWRAVYVENKSKSYSETRTFSIQ